MAELGHGCGSQYKESRQHDVVLQVPRLSERNVAMTFKNILGTITTLITVKFLEKGFCNGGKVNHVTSVRI